MVEIVQQELSDCFPDISGSMEGQFDLNAYIERLLDALARDFDGPLFGMKLHYDNGSQLLQAPAQYSGNIAWMEWRVAGEPWQAYGFQYDGASRLTQAIYNGRIEYCDTIDANYNAYYGYDARGNFTTIRRNGFLGLDAQGDAQYGSIDNLSFSYTGANMLQRVDESADLEYGFKGSNAQYTYDKGRLKTHSGNDATVVLYNFLNQPLLINNADGPAVRNAWDSNGNLHRQIQYSEQGDITRYYYDGIEYATGPDGQLRPEAIYHSEGRYVY